MKELFDIMEKDIQKENFTKREYIVYGVVAPAAITMLIGFAGWLATL